MRNIQRWYVKPFFVERQIIFGSYVKSFLGALMWWGPTFAFYGAKAECGNRAGCEKITPNDIS